MQEHIISQLNNTKIPLYMRVFEYYRELISENKLQKGEKLPSIRRCAEELSISRTTAEAAYFQLAADGYIVSKPQSGYFVTDIAYRNKKNAPEKSEKAEKNDEILYDFTSLSIDRESFDFALWRRYIKSALREDGRLLSYGEAQGEEELRSALCEYIKAQRNTVCTKENIVIGAGVQSLLHILCSILPQKKSVYFEDPSFFQGKAVFCDHGYFITDSKENADIIYISPSHTNSRGDVMTTSQRLELISFAEKENKLIIEDDYDSEFGYFNRPSPSLQGLDGGRNVIYISTFSKLLLPSIRLSFMILTDEILLAYNKKSKLYNQTASKTEQIALCQFIRDGHLSSRARKIKKLYAQKTKQLSEVVKKIFKDKAEIHISETGFALWLKIKAPLSPLDIAEKARSAKIAVKLSDSSSRILLLCSAVPSKDFEKAIETLYNCIYK